MFLMQMLYNDEITGHEYWLISVSFICYLFNDAASSSGYIASSGRMTAEQLVGGMTAEQLVGRMTAEQLVGK
jgi:hypothetical protein